MTSGAKAATTLPKMMTSRMSRTGNEMSSALAMFALTSALIATSAGTAPPVLTVMPSPARPAKSALIAL